MLSRHSTNRRCQVVGAMPRSLDPQEKILVYEDWGGDGGLWRRSGQIWKMSFPTVVRKPDRLSLSESMYRLKYFEVKTDNYSHVIKLKNSKFNLGSSYFVCFYLCLSLMKKKLRVTYIVLSLLLTVIECVCTGCYPEAEL